MNVFAIENDDFFIYPNVCNSMHDSNSMKLSDFSELKTSNRTEFNSTELYLWKYWALRTCQIHVLHCQFGGGGMCFDLLLRNCMKWWNQQRFSHIAIMWCCALNSCSNILNTSTTGTILTLNILLKAFTDSYQSFISIMSKVICKSIIILNLSFIWIFFINFV